MFIEPGNTSELIEQVHCASLSAQNSAFRNTGSRKHCGSRGSFENPKNDTRDRVCDVLSAGFHTASDEETWAVQGTAALYQRPCCANLWTHQQLLRDRRYCESNGWLYARLREDPTISGLHGNVLSALLRVSLDRHRARGCVQDAKAEDIVVPSISFTRSWAEIAHVFKRSVLVGDGWIEWGRCHMSSKSGSKPLIFHGWGWGRSHRPKIDWSPPICSWFLLRRKWVGPIRWAQNRMKTHYFSWF